MKTFANIAPRHALSDSESFAQAVFRFDRFILWRLCILLLSHHPSFITLGPGNWKPKILKLNFLVTPTTGLHNIIFMFLLSSLCGVPRQQATLIGSVWFLIGQQKQTIRTYNHPSDIECINYGCFHFGLVGHNDSLWLQHRHLASFPIDISDK